MNAKKAWIFLFAFSAIFGIAGIALFFVKVIAAVLALVAAVILLFTGLYYLHYAKTKEEMVQKEIEIRAAELRAKEEAEYFAPVVADYEGRELHALPDDYVVIDLETTGLNENTDEIVELGAIKVRHGEIVDYHSQLVKPRHPISSDASMVNGIWNDMLANAPDITEAIHAFIDFIGNDILVGQNILFDIKFAYVAAYRHLHKKALRNDYVDILSLSRRIFPGLPNYKLGTLAEHFGIAVDAAHRADADCMTELRCYQYIKKYVMENQIDLDKLFGRRRTLATSTIEAEAAVSDSDNKISE